MLALILVAVSLGMTNFAGALAIGVSGVDAQLRLRVAVAFGLFEGGMPLIGLLLGHHVADAVGSHSNAIAASLLALTGIYTIVMALRTGPQDVPEIGRWNTARLSTTGLALSVDNLVIGFALGTYHVSLPVAAVLIAAVSVAMSLVGLELGSRLGEHLGQPSELLAGTILIAVGGAIAVGVI
jgi:manganese efflux pump family protein